MSSGPTPPARPTCPYCEPVTTFGLGDPADPRVLPGQYVTSDGLVPDPAVHAAHLAGGVAATGQERER